MLPTDFASDRVADRAGTTPRKGRTVRLIGPFNAFIMHMRSLTSRCGLTAISMLIAVNIFDSCSTSYARFDLRTLRPDASEPAAVLVEVDRPTAADIGRNPASANTCASLFENTGASSETSDDDLENQPSVLRRAIALRSLEHYRYRSTELIRLTDVRDGEFGAWVTEHYPVDYLNLHVRTSQVRAIKTAPALKVDTPLASREPWIEAQRNLDFVISTYRARRPHWTPQFLEKLRAIAKEYLAEST